MFVELVEGMADCNILVARKEDERTKLLEKPIEEMELSVRSYNCLKRAGIETIGDLAKKTRADIIKDFAKDVKKYYFDEPFDRKKIAKINCRVVKI